MNKVLRKITSIFYFMKRNKIKNVVNLINLDDPVRSKKCMQQYVNHKNIKKLGFVDDLFSNYKDLKGSVIKSKEFSDYAINMLSTLEDNVFNYYHWLLLAKVFGSLGFLEFSFYLREKSIAALLSNYKCDEDKFLCARAALEYGDMKLTKLLLNQVHIIDGKNTELKIFEDFFKIIEGDSESHISLISSPLGRVVNGKTVNVIGPANHNLSIDIDDTQSVFASIGYIGKQSLPSGLDVKINISFYARAKVRQILCSSDKADQAKIIECLIVKHGPDLKALLKSGFSPSQLVIRYDFKNLFYLTSPNAGPELVYNCLLSGAKIIKIFNTDFFLTKSYPSGYIVNKKKKKIYDNSYEADNVEMCFSFSYFHHPAAQLRFYRNLMKTNLISGDHNFKIIVAMPINKYFERLDSLYGFGTWGDQ